MNNNQTAKLSALIDSLSQIGDEEKQALHAEIKKVQKAVDKSDFRYSRTKMDREIVEKALNSSIEDLEKKQKTDRADQCDALHAKGRIEKAKKNHRREVL